MPQEKKIRKIAKVFIQLDFLTFISTDAWSTGCIFLFLFLVSKSSLNVGLGLFHLKKMFKVTYQADIFIVYFLAQPSKWGQ